MSKRRLRGGAFGSAEQPGDQKPKRQAIATAYSHSHSQLTPYYNSPAASGVGGAAPRRTVFLDPNADPGLVHASGSRRHRSSHAPGGYLIDTSSASPPSPASAAFSAIASPRDPRIPSYHNPMQVQTEGAVHRTPSMWDSGPRSTSSKDQHHRTSPSPHNSHRSKESRWTQSAQEYIVDLDEMHREMTNASPRHQDHQEQRQHVPPAHEYAWSPKGSHFHSLAQDDEAAQTRGTAHHPAPFTRDLMLQSPPHKPRPAAITSPILLPTEGQYARDGQTGSLSARLRDRTTLSTDLSSRSPERWKHVASMPSSSGSDLSSRSSSDVPDQIEGSMQPGPSGDAKTTSAAKASPAFVSGATLRSHDWSSVFSAEEAERSKKRTIETRHTRRSPKRADVASTVMWSIAFAGAVFAWEAFITGHPPSFLISDWAVSLSQQFFTPGTPLSALIGYPEYCHGLLTVLRKHVPVLQQGGRQLEAIVLQRAPAVASFLQAAASTVWSLFLITFRILYAQAVLILQWCVEFGAPFATKIILVLYERTAALLHSVGEKASQ